MATNNILGFCTGANPNVTSVANWQAKPSRTSGFVSGIAISSDINASIAGGANIAHAVGEFIKNQLNEDVNPTDETALVSQFLRALQIFIQRGGACPVGSIIPYLGGEVPYGWLLANGASVLRTQYQKLFGVIGTKFGASDEAHFNLPNLHHRFIEGTTTLSEVGSYVEAGLPNIYGGSNVVGYASPNVDVLGTGAFSAMTRWVSSLQISTDGTNASSIQFDAGNSNHLYGLSGTVQPAGIYGLLLLKAY